MYRAKTLIFQEIGIGLESSRGWSCPRQSTDLLRGDHPAWQAINLEVAHRKISDLMQVIKF